MTYIAHKRDDGTVQTVMEHLRGTAELASGFAESFGASEQGYLAGMAHDLGKYSDAFQARINGIGPRVDHSTAGAFECAKVGQNPAAFCAAGHHAGLPDLGARDDRDNGSLFSRLNRAKAGMLPDYSSWVKETKLPAAGLPPYAGKDPAAYTFFIRMLYSCLVDADYLDTERFMLGHEPPRGDAVSMSALNEKLNAFLERWSHPTNELNRKRWTILQSCIDGSSLRPGLFTLTVPTGGGKTAASLAFAMNHAVKYGFRRIIYVVPYTSIIEQTAEVFRGILGSEHVLEHHSGVESDSEDAVTEQAIRRNLATENWDMPVIVTTAVQFFESLFANRSSKCRKLHNIASSVIVLDEAQMLPLPFLRPCVYALSQLTLNYQTSIVLCTATQPALESVFAEFMQQYQPRELCPTAFAADPVFSRVRIQTVGQMDWPSVAGRMEQHEQILCIVNSRKNAQTLYHLLHGEGTYHLSTMMIPADRKARLSEIRQRLQEGKPCRVVSTSLIEAGVDVDFPAVMREEAGLDSIIQAAGRCNREGKRSAEQSIVTVFQPENPPPVMFSPNIAATRQTALSQADLLSPAAMKFYYHELLDLKGREALDQHRIIEKSGNSTFPFRWIAELFRLIDADTEPVLIPVGEGRELLERCLAGSVSKALMRKAGQYSVNLYAQHLAVLRGRGDVLPAGEYGWYLNNLSLYDPEVGLTIDDDNGKAEFI